MFTTRSSLNNLKTTRLSVLLHWKRLFVLLIVFSFFGLSETNAQCSGTPCNLASLPPQPIAIDISLSSGSGNLSNVTLSNQLTAAGNCGYPGGTVIFDFIVFESSPAIGDPQPAGSRTFDCDDAGMSLTRYIVLEDNTEGTDNVFDDCDAQTIIEVSVNVTDDADPIIATSGDGPDCNEVVMLNTDMDYTYTDGDATPDAIAPTSTNDCSAEMTFTLPAFSDNCEVAQLQVNFSQQVNSPALPMNLTYVAADPIPTDLTVVFSGDPSNCTATTRVTYIITDPSGGADTCFFDVVVEDNEIPVWENPYTDSLGTAYNILDEIDSELGSNSPNLFVWNAAGSGQVAIVLDCNDPSYAQDSMFLATWTPTATDNCDTILTPTQTFESTQDFIGCTSRNGVDNVEKVFRHYFSVEDECMNELGHNIPNEDGDTDDTRVRLLVFTADPNAPWLDSDSVGVIAPAGLLSSVSPNPMISGSATVGYDFEFTADTVKFETNDAAACTYEITTDTLQLVGLDCQDITYTWEVTGSVNNFGVATALDGTMSGANDNDIGDDITIWPAGIHDIQYTAEDECGNVSTYDFVLEIIDNTPPTFADCPAPPNDTIKGVANTGLCETTLSWIIPTVSDCSGIGSKTAQATDPSGNPIQINNGNTPTGTCTDVYNFVSDYAVGNWQIDNSGGGSVDVSGAPSSIELDVPAGFFQEIEFEYISIIDDGVIVLDYQTDVDATGGLNTLTLEYSLDGGTSYTVIDAGLSFFGFTFDANGNVQIPVEANDHFIFRLSESGPGGGSVEISSFSFRCAQAAWADFPVGTSCVQYFAEDAMGNMDTCKFFVLVEDKEVPTVTTPISDQILYFDEITCGPPANSVPDYAALYTGNFDDNCNIDSVLQIPVAGDTLPLAVIAHNSTFEVIVSAWSAGLPVMDTFTVTLNDNVLPTVATCPNDVILYTDANDCNTVYTYAAPTFDDNCIGTGLAATTTSGPASGADFLLGLTTVTHTYTDDNGNAAVCEFTVEVRDTVPPVFGTTIPNVTANTSDDVPGDCTVAVSFTSPTGVTDNCSGTITYTFNPPSGSQFIVGTNPVVVTATDASGNESTSSFNVIVSDDENPEIFNCPSTFEITSVCDSITVPQIPNNVSDNCAIDTVIQSPAAGTYLIDVLGAGNVVDGATFVITQTVVDNASNTDACTTTITLDDLNQPVPDQALLPIYYTCDTLFLAPPTASTCDGQTINGVLNGVPFVNGMYVFAPPFNAPVSWSYTNPSSNQTTAQVQNITVTEDTTGPSIACPSDLSFPTAIGSCDTSGLAGLEMSEVDIFTFSNVAGTYADTCGIDEVEYALSGATVVARKDYGTTGPGSETYEHGETTVTYYVTDIHNNTSTCSFTVTVKDMEDPVLMNVPADTTVNCDAVPAVALVTASDNCSPILDIDIVFEADTVLGSCTNAYVITRKWTATDTCGNDTFLEQVLTVQDTTAPVFAGMVDTIIVSNSTGSCDGQVVLAVGSNNISDNCSSNITVTNSEFTANGADASGVYSVGETLVTFTAEDDCGNTSTHTVLVIVEDNEDPKLTCVNINLPINSTGTASIDYTDLVLFYSDNCTNDADLESTFTVSPNTFTCADIANSPINVMISVTDTAGNVATCNSFVTLQENVIPVAVCQDFTAYLDANGNVTVAGSDLDGGSSDNCSNSLTYTINGLATRDYDCSNVGTFQVTMGVSDLAGNSDDCTAMLTIADTIAPTVVCQNYTVYLDANGDATVAGADVDDGSSDACGIEFISVSPNSFDCGDVGLNDIIFTVTDSTGNATSATCTVTVLDTLAPVAMCMDQTVNLDANGGLAIAASSFNNGTTDNCSPADSITFSINGADSISLDCSFIGETVVTIMSTDTFGNTSMCMPTLTVLPDAPVEFTAGSVSGPSGAQVDIPITVSDFFVVRSFQFSIHLLDGTVATIDDILTNIPGSLVPSNTGTNDRTVTWNSPTNSGESLMDGDTAFFIRVTLVGASGDMSDIVIDGNPTVANVSQGCGAIPYVTSINLVSPGTVSIDANSSSAISGTITREGTPVNQVEVYMTGDVVDTVTTDATGTYSFNVPNGSTVTITPEKDLNVLNGLFAVDGAIIRAHIASGTPLITSPYRLLAADVDLSSSSIVMDPTAADAGIIQNLIAGNFPDFSLWGNQSWRFVPQSHTFPMMSNPWSAAVPNSETITNIVGNEIVDFEGIKNGDVDASANPANLVVGDPVVVTLENESLVAGQEYTLQFGSKDFTDMVAYQFTLNFDASKVSFIDAQANALNNIVFGANQSDAGHLAVVWSEAMSTELEESESMFSLTFIANENVDNLEDLFSIGNEIADAVGFRSDFDPIDVVFEVNSITSTATLQAAKFELYQNRPNPFKAETNIGFNLPNAGQATLTVYDISGKLIHKVEGDFARGYNEISLQGADLPEVGMLYYKLESADGIATRKMMLLN